MSAENVERLVLGRRFCQMTLARMYGRLGIGEEGPPPVHVLFITELATLGVIDAHNGTAWDSTIPIPEGVSMKGLNAEAFNYGEAPAGWHMIIMPRLRKDPEQRRRKNRAPLYESRHWMRPQLRAIGLMTRNRSRGAPRRTLIDCTNERDYPHGVPPWIYRGCEPVSLDWLEAINKPYQPGRPLYLDQPASDYQDILKEQCSVAPL